MSQLLKKENIQIINNVGSWNEAIDAAVEPLAKNGYVEKRYRDEILKNIDKFGPYFVIAPEIALLHARPEQGVISTQIGILVLKKPVKFSADGYDVRLIITLATTDNESHLGMLRKIGKILSDEDMLLNIIESDSVDDIYSVFAMEEDL